MDIGNAFFIVRDALEKAGYRQYPVTKDEFTLGTWQKTIRTEDGLKAYFIDFTLFRFPGLGLRAGAKVHFYLEHGGSFVVSREPDPPFPEEVEKFFAEVYQAMGCIPDPHNN